MDTMRARDARETDAPGASASREVRLGGAAGPPDLSAGSLWFIGAATVLLRYAGFAILTDPAFIRRGEQAPLGYGLRSKRLLNPAATVDELPPVDLVVLSHYHGDHFDPAAERQLNRSLPIVTTRHGARMVERKGFRSAVGLETWESVTFSRGAHRLRVTALPGKHRPGPFSWLFPPVMGSLLEFESPVGVSRLRVYISGDTLVHDGLREIPAHVPDIDLALLHLGGTRIMGTLLTMDAQQGVECLRILNPTLAVPIHFHDFSVYRSPLRAFRREVAAAGLERRVQYVTHGETYTFPVPLTAERSQRAA